MKDLKTWLGIGVAVVSIGGAAGSWVVLPYRVSQLEVDNRSIRTEISAVKQEAATNRELLVRIDERVKSVQEALKIQPKP